MKKRILRSLPEVSGVVSRVLAEGKCVHLLNEEDNFLIGEPTEIEKRELGLRSDFKEEANNSAADPIAALHVMVIKKQRRWEKNRI